MKSFRCRVCDSPLFFENSVCVVCGSALGFSRDERDIVPLARTGSYVDAAGLVWWVCRNLNVSGCTWLAPNENGPCFSCTLTRTHPASADLGAFRVAERAKRHLLYELDTVGLRVLGKDGPDGDPVNGLAFDLLSSRDHEVTIGHANGVITIDLSESDVAYRERVKAQLAEPYRTMLGHFRHEVGHYYQWQLVRGPRLEQRYRMLFGDPDADYQEAMDRHYTRGAPVGWKGSFISAYATMHPFEDFAESWAHFMHITDTIDSARETGLIAPRPALSVNESDKAFRDVVTQVWIPLSSALNQISRSMGEDDMYPFVIPPPVLDKLDFVAQLVRSDLS